MKLDYNRLAIEVTRRCNFFCKDFCMRGPVQNIDIRNEYIEKLLNNDFGRIYSITFTGGEPTLNPSAINYTVSKIIDDKLDVAFLDIVTNGSIYDEKIVEAARKFNNYNNNRVITNNKDADDYYDSWFQIHVSRDDFHDLKEDMSYKYSDAGIAVYDKRLSNILKSGYSLVGEELDTNPRNVRIYGDTVWSEIYLTSKGHLSTFGDGSYEYLDEFASEYLIEDDNLERFVFERLNKKLSEPSKKIKKLLKK